MSYFEFPHARTYDSDLGWLIKHFGLMSNSLDALQKWADTHEPEYEDLKNKVDGLINNLVDVISPWDSSVAYHIYSIVEYQGTNYIAIKDVPIGTMITNTEYWQPADTAIEQINAIGVSVSEMTTRLEEAIEYVTPEMFGAVGDGVTDDSSAIQAAIDTGKLVFFGAKSYYVGTALNVNSKQTLMGSGLNTRLVTNDNISVLVIDGRNREIKVNVVISNLSIIGAGNETGVGIDIIGDNVNDINDYHTITNVYIEGFEYGIRILGRAIYCRFDCIDIWLCKYGIYGRTEAFNTNVFFQVRIMQCSAAGINLETVTTGQKNKGCTFFNCAIEQTNRTGTTKTGMGAITIQNADHNLFWSCWFEGNYENTPYSDDTADVLDNNADIALVGATCYKNQFHNCIFQRTGGCSVKFTTSAASANTIGVCEYQSKCVYKVVSNGAYPAMLYNTIEASEANFYCAGNMTQQSLVYAVKGKGFAFLNTANTNTVFDGINNYYIVKQINSNFTVTEIKGNIGCEVTIECNAGASGAVLTLPNGLGTLSHGQKKHLVFLGYPYRTWKEV